VAEILPVCGPLTRAGRVVGMVAVGVLSPVAGVTPKAAALSLVVD
jgi:hypothetical protein